MAPPEGGAWPRASACARWSNARLHCTRRWRTLDPHAAGDSPSSVDRSTSTSMHLRISPTSLALFLLLGAPSLRAQSVDGATATTATLSPGDVVRIVVWRKPEFSGDFVVAPDSSITHPLYREVKVVGVPLHVVEE